MKKILLLFLIWCSVGRPVCLVARILAGMFLAPADLITSPFESRYSPESQQKVQSWADARVSRAGYDIPALMQRVGPQGIVEMAYYIELGITGGSHVDIMERDRKGWRRLSDEKKKILLSPKELRSLFDLLWKGNPPEHTFRAFSLARAEGIELTPFNLEVLRLQIPDWTIFNEIIGLPLRYGQSDLVTTWEDIAKAVFRLSLPADKIILAGKMGRTILFHVPVTAGGKLPWVDYFLNRIADQVPSTLEAYVLQLFDKREGPTNVQHFRNNLFAFFLTQNEFDLLTASRFAVMLHEQKFTSFHQRDKAGWPIAYYPWWYIPHPDYFKVFRFHYGAMQNVTPKKEFSPGVRNTLDQEIVMQYQLGWSDPIWTSYYTIMEDYLKGTWYFEHTYGSAYPRFMEAPQHRGRALEYHRDSP